ncbi:helix-turn-helix domain-containing protein [uncultured Friedmanniella sp.]|uniref:helix-turn-helix domain-containing protein n=1 Tax=uncultured Friedmanniella sp. TaxID=335381 RepID=UPI0035CBFFF1
MEPPEDVQLAGRPDLGAGLGRVRLTGRVRHGRGLGTRTLRALPEHSLVYVTGGEGSYLDGRTAHRQRVTPGSLVTVGAGVPHWYGPWAGQRWDVVFLVVEGPLFELARTTGLIDAERPVRVLEPLPYWAGRFDAFRLARTPRTVAGLQDEACRVLQLLIEVDGATRPAGGEGRTVAEGWLQASRARLEADLAERLDLAEVAAEVGMAYETWRKAFRRALGTTPAAYRTQHRIAATRDLLRYSTLPLRQVAETVGFADEHHLSRRFSAAAGLSPREFRQRLP